MYEKILTFNIS